MMCMLRKSSILVALLLISCSQPQLHREHGSREKVGRSGNRLVTPANQVVFSYGKSVPLPGMRPLALAFNPQKNLLVTSGKSHDLVVLDPISGAIRQKVQLPSPAVTEPKPSVVSSNILAPDTKAQIS